MGRNSAPHTDPTCIWGAKRRRVVSLACFLKADGGTKADGGQNADVFPESGRRHGRPVKV